MNLYVYPTIPRVYTALAQWFACLIPLLLFYRQRRGQKRRQVAAAVLGLVVLELEMVCTEGLPIVFWLPSMILAALTMFWLLWVCLDMDLTSLGCCTAWSFLLSEFAASLAWQLHYYFARLLSRTLDGLSLLPIAAVVYTLVFRLDWHLHKRNYSDGRYPKEQTKTLVTVSLICLIVFFISNLSFVVSSSPFSSSITKDIFNIRTLVDLGGLCFLYAYHSQQMELKARFEVETLKSVLDAQYANFRQTQDSIDLINRKYHDMKHQIAALRSESDPQRRSQWLNHLEQDIAVYDTKSETGNHVLDTVLSSKKLFCQQHSITLTSVVDGTLLSFMESADISALFGNALDNAIEAVSDLADPEQRLIHLSVSAQRAFLLIRVENYYEGALRFQDGLPLSTKGDEDFHGYGVKSIRYIAQQYGGSMSITSQHNWFDLKVLIPLP